MATGEDWMLGDDLQVAHKELWEAKEWLAVPEEEHTPVAPPKDADKT